MKKILTNYTLENQLRASSLFENHFILVPLRLAVIKKLVATLKNKFAPMIATLRTCLCSANPLYFSCDSLVIKDGSFLRITVFSISSKDIINFYYRYYSSFR